MGLSFGLIKKHFLKNNSSFDPFSNLDKSKIISNQQNKDDQNKKDSKTHKECENYFCDAFLNDFLNSFEYNYCPDEFFNFETDSYL